jgi:4-amino-4-deoxy-L-arabinose transferase-like glycosyltransferase
LTKPAKSSVTGSETQARKLFFKTLWVTLAVKLVLAATLPVTSDEAYFFLWGLSPDLGFYDHPPMVGWWLAALLQLGNALWWLRLPAILLSPLIALGIVYLLRERDEALAWMSGALYLVAPLSVLNTLITTDTPLILFSFLTVAAFYLAIRRDRFGWFILAGLFLGLALLSKYFAGLLAIALAAYLLVAENKPRVFTGLLVMALISGALFAVNIYWNYTHCWDNFLFNFVNRNHDPVPWYTPLIYLITLIYVVTPPVFWYLLRRSGRKLAWQPDTRLFLVLNLVPFGLLGLLSFGKIIGLHWLLGFYAFSFILLALTSGTAAVRSAWHFNVWFSLAHLLVVFAIVLTPWQLLPLGSEKERAIIDAMHGDWVWAELRPLAKNRAVFTHSYAGAAEMSYHAGRHVGVFGEGSYHARQDDKLTDFAALDGKDFLIFLNRHHDPDTYAPYFKKIEYRKVYVRGAEFEVVIGTGFRYAAYRDKVLKKINERFYTIPDTWPVGGCYFKERYQLP